jgi:hypothetical protein
MTNTQELQKEVERQPPITGSSSAKFFDTDAFEAWVLDVEPSSYFPSFGSWQISLKSNSHYCPISVNMSDDAGNIYDVDLMLRVSDHLSSSIADIVIDDMPASQEYFSEWGFRDKKILPSWNKVRLWKKIIKAIDDHCANLCPHCEQQNSLCACDEMREI